MRKKNIIIFLSACAVFLLVLLACIFILDQDSFKTLRVVVTAQNGQEDYSLFYCDEFCYAFIPSHVELEDTNIKCSPYYSINVSGKVCGSVVNCAELKTNTEYTVKLTNLFGITVSEKRLVIMQSANIPTVSISLINGDVSDVDSDRSIKKTGSVVAVTPE